MAEYRTKTGKVLTDADIEELAAEAERGYDLSRITVRVRNVRVVEVTEVSPDEATGARLEDL